MRSCPYCASSSARSFGQRLGHPIVRCRACSSLYKDLTPEQFTEIHGKAFTDTEFLDNISEANATVPARKTWLEFGHLLPPGPLLEVGPGAGYFLAAAREVGREVYGLESSAVHRDFIRKTWGIDRLFDSPEALSAVAPPFGAVVAINTIEHVYDLASMFAFLRGRLRPGGVVLISTCNAECIILPLVGTYWSMLKVLDHVSIPSAEGLRRLGARTGLVTEKVWTGEYPLETPIGVLVAARDWWRERRERPGPPAAAPDGSRRAVETSARRDNGGGPMARRLARRLMKAARGVDPSYRVTSWLGRAAAIRGLFRLSP
jgi:SAM-dependent methyltransferase